ncbi:MAG TPA: prenyltransferase/squalene oxidase repeat-containing protein [Planctomycetota bacterium]|nr:prenyltransferase/squalene oxidase repeat-containing protein [Planctomycetota bacterium]
MLILIAALLVGMQEDVQPSQAAIEKAIKAGTESLISRCPGIIAGETAFNFNEGYEFDSLVLYTLIHSGIGVQHETVQALLSRVLGAPTVRTYQVSLTAAALAAIDPAKYQAKLVQVAQFLVDTQCDNGQWSYGEKYEPATKAAPAGSGPNPTIAKIQIKRIKKLGPLVGDNSNSQYAALGLKACVSGGIEIEPAVTARAIDWWERSQQKGGGWSYHADGVFQEKLGMYGSMTAGAVSSLIMLKQIRNTDPKVASSVARGLSWLAENFTVETNPGASTILEDWRYYYLYAVERVGDLYPTEKLGKRLWYAAGATYLLKTQRSDGSWIANNSKLVIADTCFALLFLERVARRPPVATGGKGAPPAK